MGEPKPSMMIQGETFQSRAARIARDVFTSVTMVDRYEKTAGSGADDVLLEQPHEGDGPIFGIAAALRNSRSDKIWILAVDYPAITFDLLSYLGGTFARSGCRLLVPEWSGKMQMLCAGYSRELLPDLEKRIADGHYRLRNLIDPATTVVMGEKDLRRRFSGEPLLNVNTRDDYEELTRQGRIDAVGQTGPE